MTKTLSGVLAENGLESQPSFPNPCIVHFSPEELLNYFPLHKALTLNTFLK